MFTPSLNHAFTRGTRGARRARAASAAALASGLIGAGLLGGALLGATPAAATPAEPSATTYVKYSFSDRVYAVHDGGSGAPSEWLSYSEWVAAGRPTPQVVTNVPGQTVERDETSAQVYLYVEAGEPRLHLTPQQWATLGYPAPELSGNKFYAAPGGKTVFNQFGYFAPAPIKFEDWVHYGGPQPKVDGTVASWMIKTSAGNIYIQSGGGADCETRWKHVTYQEWVDMGTPNPTGTRSNSTDACNALPAPGR
ncbi:hypothetical protein JT358_05790 [Micrococcales bacterium 31B]|nr:hypothetical protein [Micrococcales bacterium 31B]